MDAAQLNLPDGFGGTLNKPSGLECRQAALSEIRDCVCRDRNASYGDAEDNFAVIARLWSNYLDVDVSSVDVAALMILMKVARIKHNPQHRDSWIDAGGYAVCGAGILKRLESEIASLRVGAHSGCTPSSSTAPVPDQQSAQSSGSTP